MNKQRRSALQKIADQLSELKDQLEDITSEEEEARDNLPMSFQGSAKYETFEDAISFLNEASESLDSAIDSVTEAIA